MTKWANCHKKLCISGVNISCHRKRNIIDNVKITFNFILTEFRSNMLKIQTLYIKCCELTVFTQTITKRKQVSRYSGSCRP